MKTVTLSQTILVLVFSLFISTIAAANKPGPKKNMESSTQKTVRNYFKFPSVLMQPTESRQKITKVEVLYTTDSRGRVTFVLANTDDKSLKAEVEKQFNTLTLPEVRAEVVHKMVLSFKVI